jgi:hypothetical protein
MNSLSMESIFLVLSGVILMAGVLYWFWSHIQLTQKKVQLLENAVFELRGMVQRGGGGGEGPGPDLVPGPELAPSSDHKAEVTSVYNDLSDDDWKEEKSEAAHASTPLESLDLPATATAAVPSDLQPGGRIEGVVVEEETKASGSDRSGSDRSGSDRSGSDRSGDHSGEQFRELFASPAPVTVTPLSEATALEGMAVKELRRLAEQRGIPNASELRKKEILSALKSQIAAPSSASAGGVQVEKMLDLTEVSEILE